MTTTLAPARTGTRRALTGVSLAYFMVLLDITVLAVAEPDLIGSLDTDVIGVGWATTAYTTAFASALVLAGGLTDRFGARRLFVAGSAGFGVVSLLCALAPGLPALIVGRVGLGLLAAAIVPSSMALLVHLFPDPAARTRAVGIWASISGAAMAAGPVLGGALVALASWRAVFVVNVPLAVLVLWLCRARLAGAARGRALSVLPHVGLVATLALLTTAVTEAGRGRWVTCAVAALVALATGLGTAVADRRSRAPLVPADLRSNRPVWRAFTWGAVVNYGLTTVLFAVPLVLDQGPLGIGITLLPMTILVALNPLATGRMVARFGPLVPIRLGLGAGTLGLAALGAVLVMRRDQGLADGTGVPILLAIALAVCGLGASWSLPALVGYAVGHAPADTAGAVGGVLNATRQIGATFGAAVTSAILVAGPSGTWVGAPFALASALCGAGLITAMSAGRTGNSSRTAERAATQAD